MSIELEPERLRLLKGRLVAAGQGDVVLPAAWVLAMLRELEEAAEAQRRWEQYRASVDAFLGRSVDEMEVGP